MSIPNAMVFGEDVPSTLPGLGEPVFVLGIEEKVVSLRGTAVLSLLPVKWCMEVGKTG
jgi:hypothetical protein